jgi:Mrp family chromosome partitioning ATPase
VGFYLELIRNVFQSADSEGNLRNRVVAFTSATSGEGVSYVVDVLARELAAQTKKRVLRVEAAELQSLADLVEPDHLARHCEETEMDNLLTLCGTETDSRIMKGQDFGAISTDWDSRPEYRATCLEALLSDFDYVLIDCPATGNSSDATTFASVVDGVAVVVKAGQTRRRQIQRSQQIIESAGGNLLGFVLNQRKYPVPSWLYSRL